MSNRKPFGAQVDTIDRNTDFIQESFDLDRLDNFVTGLGVEYLHYKSMPSPIGQNDRGDYRRSDGVDTITSNGMLYVLSGRFNGVLTDNSRDRKRGEAGTLDPSEARLVLPRFYNKNALADGDVIRLSPGDRIYVANPDADVLVSNSQKMDYEADIDNVPMFPIVQMELNLIDSRNIEYKQNIDYNITSDGNIRWIAGGRNPGIDVNTGKGRIYSIRYLYRSYYFITVLLKEVRITNVTTDGQRSPTRMPYHAIIMREYMFHSQQRGDKTNQLKSKDPKRVAAAPTTDIGQDRPSIPVDMSNIGDPDEES